MTIDELHVDMPAIGSGHHIFTLTIELILSPIKCSPVVAAKVQTGREAEICLLRNHTCWNNEYNRNQQLFAFACDIAVVYFCESSNVNELEAD